jgi:hypothetical protein
MKKCKFCGRRFDRTAYPDNTLERPSTYAKRKFCSRQCAANHRSPGRAEAKAKERTAPGKPKQEVVEILPQPLEGQGKARDQAAALVGVSGVDRTPLQYMLDIMRDPTQPAARRDEMAIKAAPYCHVKAGDLGKKQQAEDAAKEAAQGKFAPMKAPSTH